MTRTEFLRAVRSGLVLVLMSVPAGVAAQQAANPPRTSPAAELATLNGARLDSASWVSWGAGLDAALLDGDPAIDGAHYTIGLRLAPGRWIAPHWHPQQKHVYVVSGTLLFGHGAAYDTTQVTAMRPGGFAVVPAEHVHFEGAREPTVVLMYGIGPLKTNPANPPKQ